MSFKCLVVLCLAGFVHGAPQEFWKGTALDSTVEKLRDSCAENNSFACIQFKAFAFLDNVLHGSYFEVIIYLFVSGSYKKCGKTSI